MEKIQKNILSRETFSIPEFNADLEGIGASTDAFREINQAAKEIFETVNFSHDDLHAVMDLPPESKVDNETLALAIETLLNKHFKIKLPGEEMMSLKTGQSVKFSSRYSPELPARLVQILLEAQQRLMKISGKKAENGRDGFSDLSFNWRKKTGSLAEGGKFDLKKLNSFPSVRANETLATIHLQTDGAVGINSKGKAIKQQKGIPIGVKWNQNVINKVDDPSDANIYYLKSIKGGIVQFSLRDSSDQKGLNKIDITDTITINGDVDYGVGDIGNQSDDDTQCTANIIIKGSVLGVFSLQSTGYIHVSGSVEGRSLIAQEVETGLITSGSSVTATAEVTTGGIINAKAKGTRITIKKNASQAVLIAQELVIFEPYAACLGMEIYTKKAEMKLTKFSGVTKFFVGIDLFNEAEQLMGYINESKEKLGAQAPAVKESALAIITHLVKLDEIAKKGRPPEIMATVKKIIDCLKVNMIPVFQKAGSTIDPNVVPLCYRMQSIFSNYKFDDSILRKVDALIARIKQYNSMQNEIVEIQKKQQEYQNRYQELRGQISTDLELKFFGIILTGNNAELRIECGDAVMKLIMDDIPSGDFTVKYSLTDEQQEDLRKGQLKLASS